jgi:hypothetical protein
MQLNPLTIIFVDVPNMIYFNCDVSIKINV